MEFTARQIAQLLNARVEGDENAAVNQLSKIEEGAQGTLSFLANAAYTDYIYTTKASIVIVNETFKPDKALPSGLTLLRVPDAYAAFARLLEFYNNLNNSRTGIEEGAFIHPSARVSDQAYVGAGAYVGEDAVLAPGVQIHPHVFVGARVHIGKASVIHAGVRIYHGCQIGANCIIHSNVVIGADGFGFAPQQGGFKKVPQIGNVIIEDEVEIGAGTCIDRATLGSTRIRKGVKLDNLIQIAHNCDIGENTVIAAQTGIAGSTTIGKNCMIGGQVGIVGHLKIADGVKIAAQSGIGTSIETENSVWQGSPAFNASEYKRSYVAFRNLPDISRRLGNLEKGTTTN